MAEQIRNASIVVGTTIIQVAPELKPGQRTALAFTNTSTTGQIITLSWGQEAAAGAGVVLYPAGSWAESIDAVFQPSERLVTAIASATGGTLGIHERVKV